MMLCGLSNKLTVLLNLLSEPLKLKMEVMLMIELKFIMVLVLTLLPELKLILKLT